MADIFDTLEIPTAGLPTPPRDIFDTLSVPTAKTPDVFDALPTPTVPRIEPPADLSRVPDASVPIRVGADLKELPPYHDPNAQLKPDTTGPIGRALRFVGQKLEPITPKNMAFPRLTAADIAAGNVETMLPGIDPETGQSTRSQVLPSAPAPTWAKVAAGAQHAAAGVTEAVVPFIVGGQVQSAVQVPLLARGISAAFAADMLRQLPTQAKVFYDAYRNGDVQTATEAALGGTVGAIFSVLALHHAVGPRKVPRFDTLGNPIINRETGEPEMTTIGIAQESPAVRALLTRKITSEYTPEQIKEVYRKVNVGEANPAEQELVRFINSALESPGQALRQGATVTERTPRIESEFWRNYLGLKEGGRTVRLRTGTTDTGEPIYAEQPKPTGEPNAPTKQGPVAQIGSEQAQSVPPAAGGSPGQVQVPPREAAPGTVAPPPAAPPAPVTPSSQPKPSEMGTASGQSNGTPIGDLAPASPSVPASQNLKGGEQQNANQRTGEEKGQGKENVLKPAVVAGGEPSATATAGLTPQTGTLGRQGWWTSTDPAVRMSVHVSDTGILLNSIEAVTPGTGAGTAAIKRLMVLADATNKPLTLTAEALDKTKQAGLERLYARLGFQRTKENEFVYQPGKAPVNLDATVDTIAGKMDLVEFEKKGYAPEQVTQADWVNLQRAERRRLGQSEESGPPASPFQDYKSYHEDAVRRALAKGEEIDPQVLADYPDLVKPAAPTQPPVIKGSSLKPKKPKAGTVIRDDARNRLERALVAADAALAESGLPPHVRYADTVANTWGTLKAGGKPMSPEAMELRIKELEAAADYFRKNAIKSGNSVEPPPMDIIAKGDWVEYTDSYGKTHQGKVDEAWTTAAIVPTRAGVKTRVIRHEYSIVDANGKPMVSPATGTPLKKISAPAAPPAKSPETPDSSTGNAKLDRKLALQERQDKLILMKPEGITLQDNREVSRLLQSTIDGGYPSEAQFDYADRILGEYENRLKSKPSP